MTDIDITAQIAILGRYTPCDISDALQKLGVKGAGFVPDLVHRNKPTTITSTPSTERIPPLIAPATTILFLPLPLTTPPPTEYGPRTLPPGTHYADLPHLLHTSSTTSTPTILILSHPPSTPPRANALLGSLVAHRLAQHTTPHTVAAVLINGRARDITSLPPTPEIYSLGTSTVGAGAGSVAWSINTAKIVIEASGTEVEAGDLLVVGRGGEEGEVVCIPRERVGEVVRILPGLVERDERVLEDVLGGRGLAEAIKARRG